MVNFTEHRSSGFVQEKQTVFGKTGLDDYIAVSIFQLVPLRRIGETEDSHVVQVGYDCAKYSVQPFEPSPQIRFTRLRWVLRTPEIDLEICNEIGLSLKVDDRLSR